MCSVPGHATVVHTTGEFAVRKLVVDTFGWLSFKHWFLEVTITIVTTAVYILFLSRLSSGSGGQVKATAECLSARFSLEATVMKSNLKSNKTHFN